MMSLAERIDQLAAWARRRLFSIEQSSNDDSGRPRGIAMAVCLMVSVLIWLSLSLDETHRIEVDLDAHVVNMHPDSVLINPPPAEVRAMVSGTGMNLFKVRFNRPIVELDASQGRFAAASVEDLPTDVTVVELIPPYVTLEKDAIVSKRVPIELRARFEPSQTHHLFGELTLVPDSVTISGAGTLVNAISAWPSVATVHTGFQDTVEVVVSLVDSLSGLVSLNHLETKVLSRAHQFTEAARILRVRVTDLPTTQPPVELDPVSVEVTYRVALEHYDLATHAQDFYATVPYAVIRSDTTGRVVPQIHLPTELLVDQTDVFPRTLAYFIYLGTE